MANTVIYGIVDPSKNELRYVGQTVNFTKRKSAHRRTALKNKNNSYVYNWLRSLYDKGIEPEFIVLEECTNDKLDNLEVFYIEYFKMIGCHLTNSAVGGASKRGFKQSEATKKKISNALKGNSWNRGKILPQEVRKKISTSNTGIRHSKESKDKISLKKIKHKPVLQMSSEEDIIKIFSSAYIASKELSINRKSIGNVLSNRAKTAGGYYWKYY